MVFGADFRGLREAERAPRLRHLGDRSGQSSEIRTELLREETLMLTSDPVQDPSAAGFETDIPYRAFYC